MGFGEWIGGGEGWGVPMSHVDYMKTIMSPCQI